MKNSVFKKFKDLECLNNILRENHSEKEMEYFKQLGIKEANLLCRNQSNDLSIKDKNLRKQ